MKKNAKKIYQFNLLWYTRYVSSLGDLNMHFHEQKIRDERNHIKNTLLYHYKHANLIERAWFRDQSIWMVGPPGGGPGALPTEFA